MGWFPEGSTRWNRESHVCRTDVYGLRVCTIWTSRRGTLLPDLSDVRPAPTMVVADVSARQTGPLPKAPQHLSKPHPRGEVRVQARVVPAESKEDEGAHCFSREFQRKCHSHTDTIRGLVDAPSVYAKGTRSEVWRVFRHFGGLALRVTLRLGSRHSAS